MAEEVRPNDESGIDESLIKDIETRVEELGKDLVSNKIEEIKVLQQAADESGIDSKATAYHYLMEYLNVGIRALAVKTKVPRKKLVLMIEGTIPMPPDVADKIQRVFELENKKQKKNLEFNF